MESPIRIAISREDDGRWIAEAVEFPGVLKYGATREEARAKAEALARKIDLERALEVRAGG